MTQIRPFAAAAAAALLLAACGPDAGAPPQMPPPEVTVVTLAAAPVSLERELAGRATPFLVAEVRPQATGIVQRRLFDEGAQVSAGQPLYQLDSSNYRAAAESARANLARAQATATSARLAAERSARLVRENLVSAQADETAQAQAQAAAAEVAAARAALAAAEVNLGHTRIVAPISGRIGKSSVTAGALVTANQAEPLATIQQTDPMYVDLSQSAAEWLALQREVQAGRLAQDGAVEVRLLLEDGTPYDHRGRLAFTDVTVDPGTGSYALRAVVPNPDQLLLPGMYLRAVVDMGRRADGVLVPQRAVTRDAKGDATALVVGADGTVELRTLKASRTIGDQWLVDEGLQAGERVIVEGLQKVQPGGKATPVEAGAATAAGDAASDADAPAAAH